VITVNIGNVAVEQITPLFAGAGPRDIETVPTLLFALDEESVVYFAADNENGPSFTFNVYVIDASGAYTYYSAGNIPNQYFSEILPLGPGLFFVTLENSDTFFVQVANLKLNNSSPILIKKSAFPISNPCYSQNPHVFYDGFKKLLAVGFYQPAGQYGTNIYGSVYKVSSSQLVLQNTGLASAGVVNTFDQTGGTPSTPGWTTTLNWIGTQSNGISVGCYNYSHLFTPPYIFDLIFTNNTFSVNGASQTDCNTLSGLNVTSKINAFLNIGDYQGAVSYTYGCDSTLPGMWGVNFSDAPPPYSFFTDNNILYNFTVTNPNSGFAAYNCVLTRKYLFAFGGQEVVMPDGSSQFFSGFIYCAPNPGIQNGNSVTSRNSLLLVNSARPISLTGAYKT